MAGSYARYASTSLSSISALESLHNLAQTLAGPSSVSTSSNLFASGSSSISSRSQTQASQPQSGVCDSSLSQGSTCSSMETAARSNVVGKRKGIIEQPWIVLSSVVAEADSTTLARENTWVWLITVGRNEGPKGGDKGGDKGKGKEERWWEKKMGYSEVSTMVDGQKLALSFNDMLKRIAAAWKRGDMSVEDVATSSGIKLTIRATDSVQFSISLDEIFEPSSVSLLPLLASSIPALLLYNTAIQEAKEATAQLKKVERERDSALSKLRSSVISPAKKTNTYKGREERERDEQAKRIKRGTSADDERREEQEEEQSGKKNGRVKMEVRDDEDDAMMLAAAETDEGGSPIKPLTTSQTLRIPGQSRQPRPRSSAHTTRRIVPTVNPDDDLF